jgi:hypothetical protein
MRRPKTGVQPGDMPCYGSKKIICHSEMTLEGGMECAPAINIKFYACCTFQKTQEDIDSSKCHSFKMTFDYSL